MGRRTARRIQKVNRWKREPDEQRRKELPRRLGKVMKEVTRSREQMILLHGRGLLCMIWRPEQITTGIGRLMLPLDMRRAKQRRRAREE